ncbi:MAG: hypothetical protein IJ740_06010 [Ruminococcus sp.]|nr:hypothetical protein [Ruminococcus sp.]
MTDFEIFGIVDMGKRTGDYQRKTEKVAQLQFLTSKKKRAEKLGNANRPRGAKQE